MKVPSAKHVSASASEEGKKQDKGTFYESKLKAQKVESTEEVCGLDCYDKSSGKLVLMDVDREVTRSSGKDSLLAFLPNRSEKEEINKNVEAGRGMKVGMVILVFENLIETLDYENG